MSQPFKWTIDQTHSEISFQVKHMMIANVKGRFTHFDARIFSPEKNISSASFDLWIDASSIVTGDAKRDEHLKGPDFLDVTNHRQISFVSGSIGKPDLMGNAEMWGEFTLKGITKNIKLNLQIGGMVIDPWGREKAGFSVSGVISRSQFGLTWNTVLINGGFLVGDEVRISCEMEASNDAQDPGIMEIDPNEPAKGSL